MSVNDFEILARLGEGAYSSVYKVRRIVDKTIYALKKVKLINLSPRQIHNAVNQVRILASIRHPNIVCYKEAFYDSNSKSLCIVMEYADGGDLLQKIFQWKRRGMFFQQGYIWDVFSQALRGLAKLHQMNILHRDIKVTIHLSQSANVFLMKNGTVKLGDMNVSKVIRKDAMCQTQTGTPYYASPQVWRDEPYDAKSDIWSLGCVLYELINLKPPFRAKDMEGLYKKVLRGYYGRINKSYSQDLSNFLKLLIKVKPNERLTCGELLSAPVMRKRTKPKFQTEVEEESILLKTIKLSKNINYLTQKLPKPNYSPIRYKSMLNNRVASELKFKLSLPPIKNKFIVPKSQNKKRLKKQYSDRRLSNEESLPRINLKKNKSKQFLY